MRLGEVLEVEFAIEEASQADAIERQLAVNIEAFRAFFFEAKKLFERVSSRPARVFAVARFDNKAAGLVDVRRDDDVIMLDSIICAYKRRRISKLRNRLFWRRFVLKMQNFLVNHLLGVEFDWLELLPFMADDFVEQLAGSFVECGQIDVGRSEG